MAQRIVFLPTYGDGDSLFSEHVITFDWVPGMSKSQNQKWIRNLHKAATEQIGIERLLEISSRSETQLGIELSAFNLKLHDRENTSTVECLYQGSKVFKNGGPYIDLYGASSKEAKLDPRIKESGDLTHYEFRSQIWELSDSPNFYDYIYILALSEFEKAKGLLGYQAFTDFAYSQINTSKHHGRAFNCQARSAAIYLSLRKLGYLEEYLDEPEKFLPGASKPLQIENNQLDLF